jgi:hypothetical protein
MYIYFRRENSEREMRKERIFCIKISHYRCSSVSHFLHIDPDNFFSFSLSRYEVNGDLTSRKKKEKNKNVHV